MDEFRCLIFISWFRVDHEIGVGSTLMVGIFPSRIDFTWILPFHHRHVYRGSKVGDGTIGYPHTENVLGYV